MAEAFLEEQLRRIREMTEQVSHIRPLCDVHDVRNRSSERAGWPHKEPAPARKATARHAMRRRR